MKKFLSVLLAVAMLTTLFCSVQVIQASGAQADAETGASGHVIYFDAASCGWDDGERILLYCYDPSGLEEELIPWGSNKRGGMTDEGNGIYSYDFDAKGIDLQSGKQYSLIFNHNGIGQTHDLLFEETCYGDTVYANSDIRIENPADSSKSSFEARWRSGKLGPMKCITSIGNVVGEVIPAYTSAYGMFVSFLVDTGAHGLTNAMNYSGKSVQQMIDDTAAALGLSKSDVKSAVSEANAIEPYVKNLTSQWKASNSSLPDGSAHDDHHVGPGTDWSDGRDEDDDYVVEYNPYRIRKMAGTPYGDFCDYLVNGFAADTRKYGDKTEQQIIDSKASELGLCKDDVALALGEINAESVEWNTKNSSLKAGKSGATYVKGAYYLVVTDSEDTNSGIKNVDKNAMLAYKEDSGYYIISHMPIYQAMMVDVARYDGSNRFTIVSKESLTMPRYNEYLFFFRPESDGYNFGFNNDNEYEWGPYSRSGSSDGSGSSGTVIIVSVDSVTDEMNGVSLQWSKPSGVSVAKYRVFSYTNGKWTKLGDTSSLNYTHTAAVPGKVYRYTVRGMDAKGNYITSYNATGWYHRYLRAPKITGVENTADGARINWEPISGNARYRVYVKNGISWDAMGDTYETSFLHRAKREKASADTPVDGKSYPKRSGNVILFDAASCGWDDGERILLYCYDPSGIEEELIPWGSYKKGGMLYEGNGIYSYDFDAKGIELLPGKQYSLIFSHNGMGQTHDLLFDTTCFGDTAYAISDSYVENPNDSSKRSLVVHWGSGKLGPAKFITSIGNVVGDVIPAYTSAYGMFVNFLADSGYSSFQNARYYSGKTDQQIIDDTASALGLSKDDVREAISESGCYADWSASKSTLGGSEDCVDGYTYRYMVRCVSYDGYREVGAYSTDGVSNKYVAPAKPTQPPTEPPTDPEPECIRGDADGDGNVTIMDATRIQRWLASLSDMNGGVFTGTPLTAAEKKAADADGDNSVTIMDATAIQRFKADLPTNESIGKPV